MKVNKLRNKIIKISIFIFAFMTVQIINVKSNVVMAKYSKADISEVTGGIDILKDRSKLEKDINLLGRRPI